MTFDNIGAVENYYIRKPRHLRVIEYTRVNKTIFHTFPLHFHPFSHLPPTFSHPSIYISTHFRILPFTFPPIFAFHRTSIFLYCSVLPPPSNILHVAVSVLLSGLSWGILHQLSTGLITSDGHVVVLSRSLLYLKKKRREREKE